MEKDGAKYFGPFMGGISVKSVIEIINQCFELRTCKQPLPNKNIKRECINYHIGRCSAPCMGRISREDYLEKVEKAIDFLSGNDDYVEQVVRKKMEYFAEIGEFESAISFRDKLGELDKIKQKKITDLNRFINADIIAVASDGLYASVNVLVTRSGRMQGGEHYSVSSIAEGDGATLSEFILRYYREGKELPGVAAVAEK